MDKCIIGGESKQVKYKVKGERKADYTILVNMPSYTNSTFTTIPMRNGHWKLPE